MKVMRRFAGSLEYEFEEMHSKVNADCKHENETEGAVDRAERACAFVAEEGANLHDSPCMQMATKSVNDTFTFEAYCRYRIYT